MIWNFHFIRPWWLVALIPLALLIWRIQAQSGRRDAWRSIVAPHLLSHLLLVQRGKRHFLSLAILATTWGLAVLAVAGPTWRREPSPFAQDTSAIAIVVKVSPSMRSQDVQPDRLTRCGQKIADLLKLRPGTKAALIAYRGSAHMVVPLTSDPGIITNFANVLDPKIMPTDGDAAVDTLKLGRKLLNEAQLEGSILWITDGITLEQARLASQEKDFGDIHVLAAVANDPEAMKSARNAADAVGADLTAISADDSDVDQLARDTHFADVASQDSSQQWHESGYYLIPLLLLAAALQFRRGVLGSIAQGRGS